MRSRPTGCGFRRASSSARRPAPARGSSSSRSGGGLARRLSLTQPEHKLRLLFGSGADAGKVMLSVDNELGKFHARRDKQGRYSLTINAASAEGLFALDFPLFAVPRVEALRPDNGKPPHCCFTASAAMLAVED